MTQGDATSEGVAPPGVPRWVKWLAATVLIVLLLLVFGMMLVGGEHGPGRHGG